MNRNCGPDLRATARSTSEGACNSAVKLYILVMNLPNLWGASKICVLLKFQVFIFLPAAAHGEHYSSIGKTISNFLSLGWGKFGPGAYRDTFRELRSAFPASTFGRVTILSEYSRCGRHFDMKRIPLESLCCYPAVEMIGLLFRASMLCLEQFTKNLCSLTCLKAAT